ncbi:MAG: hypothetical protein EOP84_25720 [Verrucomicrobiaceae bacterium]|nr:MAG: hypothetical protein EOP84_25720 [Verrucomicrobiaceae bacterium]
MNVAKQLAASQDRLARKWAQEKAPSIIKRATEHGEGYRLKLEIPPQAKRMLEEELRRKGWVLGTPDSEGFAPHRLP